jgi:hypothetical protein
MVSFWFDINYTINIQEFHLNISNKPEKQLAVVCQIRRKARHSTDQRQQNSIYTRALALLIKQKSRPPGEVGLVFCFAIVA